MPGKTAYSLSIEQEEVLSKMVKYTQNITYTFGMQMPGRSFSSGSFRYGFQGQEKDNEIKGDGNSINYKYRIHDPRLGRFLSVDPLAKDYPDLTTYQLADNNPIENMELEGLEGFSTRFIGTLGLHLSFSKKRTSFSVSAGIGTAMMFANGVSFEGSAKGNLSLYGQSGFLKAAFNYSFSGMAGVGNTLNMAGFGTTGSASGDGISIPDFMPSVGIHSMGANPAGNNFKGIGVKYASDLDNTTPPNLSFTGRLGFGVKSSDGWIPNSQGPLLDFNRSTTEFGINGSFNIGTGDLDLRSSLLTSKSEFRSSGYFLNPKSQVNISGKMNYQIGVNVNLNKGIGFKGLSLSLTKGGSSQKLLLNASGNYNSDSGFSGSIGTGLSSAINSVNGL
jgi:RHS repeat-associated protein